MKTIQIQVSDNKARVIRACPLTTGTVGQQVEFSFDDSWGQLLRTAVFRCGQKQMIQPDVENTATVPWELLQYPGQILYAGVYGIHSDGTVRIPTLWTQLGTVFPGAEPEGDESIDPTAPVWQQILQALEKKQDLQERVTAIEDGSTHSQYPTARAVYNALERKCFVAEFEAAGSDGEGYTLYSLENATLEQLEQLRTQGIPVVGFFRNQGVVEHIYPYLMDNSECSFGRAFTLWKNGLWTNRYDQQQEVYDMISDMRGHIVALFKETSKMESTFNRVSQIGQTPSDERYPTEKAVCDYVQQEMPGFKNLYGRVEVTDEDIAAAGETGITTLSIGSENVDLSGCEQLMIRLYVPADEALNPETGLLRIGATQTDAGSTASADQLLFTQSIGISTVCGITPARNNLFCVTADFCGDTFLQGLVVKNGYSSSGGYAGPTNGWCSLSPAFLKSRKKYFHISAWCHSAKEYFRFPAGSYVEIYGR